MVFSQFSSIFLHLQPFATLSSASLLIPLQTVLLRTPTDAALRWALDPYFFLYACLYVPSFFKAAPFLHFMPFFQTFSCVPAVFPEFPSCNFLIFPTVSSISLVFPSLPFIFSSSLMVFFHNFPPCSSVSPLLLTMFLHFPLVFSYLFPSVFKGPRKNRTPPSPNCLVAHAPLNKNPIGHPNHHPISRFWSTWATSTPPHPLYSLRSRKQLCLAYRLAFVILMLMKTPILQVCLSDESPSTSAPQYKASIFGSGFPSVSICHHKQTAAWCHHEIAPTLFACH